MKKTVFGLLSACILALSLGGASFVSANSAQELADQIIATANDNMHPQESLVQWYYAVEGLRDKLIDREDSSQEALEKIQNLTDLLRIHLDDTKSSFVQSGANDFWNTYEDRLDEREDLSDLCRNVYQLADDWSFALNLPTALTIGVLDMESSCRMSNPNDDGIFQIISNDYEPGEITTGHRISQIYDFNDFVHRNRAWYHDANKLDIANCVYKDTSLVGQIAPICLSYTDIDLDSVIKIGALYNGLKTKEIIDGEKESRIKGDIQPTNGNYVYGKFDDEHMDTNKDGLIIRMLQVLEYQETL